MKIKKLIEIFEQLLSIYEKGLTVKNDNLKFGLCYAYSQEFDDDILYSENLFDDNGYYNNYLLTFKNCKYKILFKNGDIKSRINFLKKQIPELEKLLKQGYTDV
jgi:hypothetical protein